jgi:hypothetical protein
MSNTYLQQFWSLRQNPCANTNQAQIRELIISQNIVTCPFGHFPNERNNVINREYNESHQEWKSQSQDRKFIETMNIGDIVVIPFAGIKNTILARITSSPIFGITTGMFQTEVDGEINISHEGTIPFCPVGRTIEILNAELQFNDKRVLGQSTFCKIRPEILPLQNK